MCLRGGVGFGPQVLLHYSCRGLGTGIPVPFTHTYMQFSLLFHINGDNRVRAVSYSGK